MLTSLGYDVVSSNQSLEAITLFREKPEDFDLVITDMTMPRMTGDILASEMLSTRPDVPIILCTGYSERISKEKAEAMGIGHFLMKPIQMRVLADVVRRMLDENRSHATTLKRLPSVLIIDTVGNTAAFKDLLLFLNSQPSLQEYLDTFLAACDLCRQK